jgi:hypothetical protein
MPVVIEEMTTTVDVTTAAAPAAGTPPRSDSLAERERARRSSERAVRIARRTQSEGYDD